MKIKTKEEAAKKEKNLGRVGVQGFKSRSLQAWQEAGASHLFPVDPQKVCCVSAVITHSLNCTPSELRIVLCRGLLGNHFVYESP